MLQVALEGFGYREHRARVSSAWGAGVARQSRQAASALDAAGFQSRVCGFAASAGGLVPPVGGVPCSGATLELKVQFIIYL